jgi:transposase
MQTPAIADYKDRYELSQLKIVKLEAELVQLKKMIFGSRHERFVSFLQNTSQLTLEIKVDEVAACNVANARKISYIKSNSSIEQKPLVHPGRMKLPESLRCEEIIIEPSADLTGCKPMGEEITEVLEYEPGELFVKRYKRIKYARPGNGGILIGELPSIAQDKNMFGPGLKTQIIIDKFVDHIPVYRQMQRFERSGIKLSYSTLSDAITSTCKLMVPLQEAFIKQVLACNYLHADETPIKVLDKDKKGTTHRGYYWVYYNSIERLVLFDYREGRSREGPLEMLDGFTGYLLTDGYNAYDIFEKNKDIILLNCMAHARRMFNDALDNDEPRAAHAMREIQKLYAIERKCKEQGLSFDEIKTFRTEQSAPILALLGTWMKQQYLETTPKSLIGKALGYSIERWIKLSRYTENGMLAIDNNVVENTIRPIALGRKNYLFAGSHEAAKRSAMLYSMMETCKLHGINPHTWLKEVLERLPSHSINRISELLPHLYQQ